MLLSSTDRRLVEPKLREPDALAASWVGHATLLLRIGGKLVVTDPVWSNRVGLSLGPITLGPRRLTPASFPLADLPRPDLILLSHAHFDHLDVPTLWRIGRRFPDTPVVTAAKTADLLRPTAFCHVVELASVDRQTTTVAGIEITALPVNHWTPRVFADTWRTANAYLLRVGSRSVFFGGDTAMTNHFDAAGPVDLAVLGIGAYNPYVASHATPEQAWAMASAMGARHVAAMHHRTFRLSYEPDAEPLTRLLAAAGEGARHIVIRRPGDVWSADKIAT